MMAQSPQFRPDATGHDLIVIGASSGGVEALQTLVAGLPDNLPAAVCIVLHQSSEAPGLLPLILRRRSALPVLHPVDGEPLVPGRIYVAPPDRHLLVEGDVLRVTRGPRENRHRPAVDPLFRSAAVARGPRVIGVILTGALNDGTAGLAAVKRQGGSRSSRIPPGRSSRACPRARSATWRSITACRWRRSRRSWPAWPG
jgi:two-component system chemotaxis response regulator CheB